MADSGAASTANDGASTRTRSFTTHASELFPTDDVITDNKTTAEFISGLETSDSGQTRGGLYSRWEGLQPLDVQAKDGPATTVVDADKLKPEVADKLQDNKRTHVLPAATDTTIPAAAKDGSMNKSSAAGNAASVNSNPSAGASNAPLQSDIMHGEARLYGEAYSERNPAPNIAGLKASEQKRQDASRRYFEQKSDGKDGKAATAEGAEGEEVRAGATDDVPIGAEKSNVLFQPTPNVNFSKVFETIHADARQTSYVIFASIVILDWMFIGGGWRGFLKSLFPAAGVVGLVYLILINIGNQAADRRISMEEPKTEKLRYVPESVEWMNTLVETLWHTLQQDFFDNIASQVNDTIKPYIPAGVPATVKIAELGHGTHSARVLSMRSLPDSEFGDLVPTHGIDKSGSVEQAQQREKAVEREEGGVFYNLEIAIAYHQAPLRPRKEHMHVDILAMIGPVPIPIFVEVKEFVATIRIRLQMHPDLPFLKNATFALTETPKIGASVSLGAPWALDLLNLPVIDSVLHSQIQSAASDFVQPKSMSLDMTVYVGGSDQLEETKAIGVLFVKIHRARNLARQDTRGPGADPYLTIAFSKYEKPMYATRIIKGDRNPVWEETAVIMIGAEHVKRQENVLLRLWDSDTTGSDDVSGICEFPLQELILDANKMQKREDKLQGDTAGTDAEGVLEWEIGYFPRASYDPALRTTAKDPKDHHGEKKEVSDEEKTQDAQNTVPDPNLPSGILGLTIHQCINVQIDNPNKKSMGYVKVQRQDSDGEDADDDDEDETSIDYIPSLYVSADIDDELIYRTRVKSISSAPTYNSSTETYVRDWRLATLNLSVWDTRKKTDDALVGVTSLKLSDIFHESSSVVKFYDLKGGAGTGRIRVSMIFRSVRMKLEESLLGYSVGTFVFTSPIVATGEMHTKKLNLRTSGSERTIKSSKSEGNSCTWTLEKPENCLPVHFRYLSPVVLEFVSGGITDKLSSTLGKTPLGRTKHYAIIWLSQLIDNKDNNFTLPIYKTNNEARYIQNQVHESDPTMELTKVGEVTFSGKFKAGIDETHSEFLRDHDHWSTFEAWKAAKNSGM